MKTCLSVFGVILAGFSVSLGAPSANYGPVPLHFEWNAGQTDRSVDFVAHGPGYRLFLRPTEMTLALPDGALRVRLEGADPRAHPTALDPLESKVHYLVGNDPSHWRKDIPTCGKVRYAGIYRGVDVVYYGNNQHLEYDFVVAPGTDPRSITLAFDGAERLRLDRSGRLWMRVAGGELWLDAPVIYQESDGRQEPVAGRYVFKGGNRVGFRVAKYDRKRPLVIDPVLVYSTYIGVALEGNGIAVDAAGNAYVTGRTTATNYPTTVGAFDTTYNGTASAFMSKLNSNGTALVYSTYLGGSSSAQGHAIAVDTDGRAYVTGNTLSTNFPTTANALQTNYGGTFLTVLDPGGSNLVYSTFLGNSAQTQGFGVATDNAGHAFVTGDTRGLTTTPGAFQTTYTWFAGVPYVVKINILATGTASLVYGTYLGGTSGESQQGSSIAVDQDGNAHVTGVASSTDFVVTNAIQTTLKGLRDAFVTKLNSNGTALVYSTYLGGDSLEGGSGIAVDTNGNTYVTGWTNSTNFPTSGGAYLTILGGPADVFVTKLSPAGALLYSTYLGGPDIDTAFDIAVNAEGHAHVLGEAGVDFPLTSNPLPHSSLTGGFVTKLNSTGTGLLYSSYFGEGSLDEGGIALDGNGDAYVTGTGGPVPTTPGTYNPNGSGIFVAKISDTTVVPTIACTLVPTADTNLVGTTHTLTATVLSNSIPVNGIPVDFFVETGPNVGSAGSDTSDANGEAFFQYDGLGSAGTDTLKATGSVSGISFSATATKVWVDPTLIACALAPGSATNLVGEVHSVTSTVTSNGVPVSGVTVDFNVTAGPNAGENGTDTTDVNGEAVFQYTGSGSAGTDAISATGMVSTVAINCSATKVWLEANPDLVLTKNDSADPIELGDNLTYTVRVVNNGTISATDVTVTDALPASVTFVSASAGCTHIGANVVCDLGTLAVAQTSTVTIVVAPQSTGSITNTATATASEADANSSDNTDTEITEVIGGLPDLAPEIANESASCTNSPGPVCQLAGDLTLSNQDTPFASASFDFAAVCKKCPTKVKWKLSGLLTIHDIDLTGVPAHTIALYLSTNDVLDELDILLVKKPVALADMAKAFSGGKPIKLKAKVPAGEDISGKYLIFVQDNGNGVAESDETNNIAVYGPLP